MILYESFELGEDIRNLSITRNYNGVLYGIETVQDYDNHDLVLLNQVIPNGDYKQNEMLKQGTVVRGVKVTVRPIKESIRF